MVAPTNEIPLNTVGATSGRPHKINGENKTIRRRTKIPTFIVGGDVLDAPQRCSLYLSASTDVRTIYSASHKQTEII